MPKLQVMKFLHGSLPPVQHAPSCPRPLQGVPLPQNMTESTSTTCEAFGVNDDPLHWIRSPCVWVTVRLQVYVDLQGTVCQRPGPQPGGQTVRGCWVPTTQPTLTSSMMDLGHQVTYRPPSCSTSTARGGAGSSRHPGMTWPHCCPDPATQHLNLREQFCQSKGKKSTLMRQVLRKMAGGSQ